ncbi:hypothetical protein [Jiella mangrovi]|uniref:Uncharacterized protein n=1 Tax=Jiella mangrovi TaxID=2821407 RepID=A0ABS4BII1_9HYPH|nr:hypothetical protein [Jiella mangrovi]MBP0616342.1 hypothetical protein [Jiella mangrovi]
MTKTRNLSALAATISCLCLLALGMAGRASAQSGLSETDPQLEPGRYEIVRIDGAVARLDTATGELSPCRVVADALTCGNAAGPRDQAASNARIRALEKRVSALEAELSKGGSALTGSDETDAAIARMQKLFRGFADIVKELEEGRDAARGTDASPPDRT